MKLKSLSQKDRYGNMFSFEFFEPDASIPMMMVIPDMADGYNGADTATHPGEPKGTDTVPAWLTPGENVVNAEASRLPGNQEKIDEMNEQGRRIQKAQGGPIPSYAAGGMQIPRPDGMLNSLSYQLEDRNGGPMYAAAGDWITDELLDRLRMVESSGNPNAVSRAGAIGPYQIMPKTAAQPGYNTTPLAIEDLNDEAKSREFARQYLTGLQAQYPDYTPEEILMAYNAGPGRMRKYKAGEGEPLAAETLNYASKILTPAEQQRQIVAGVPQTIGPDGMPLIDLGYIGDDSGTAMSAYATTAAVPVPPATATPPVTDQGEYGVNDTIIRNGVPYTWNAQEESYIDAEGREYSRTIGEFFRSEIDPPMEDGKKKSLLEGSGENYGPQPGDVLVGEKPQGGLLGVFSDSKNKVYKDKDGNFIEILPNNKRNKLVNWAGQEDDIVFNDPEARTVVPEKPDSKELKPLPGATTGVTPQEKDGVGQTQVIAAAETADPTLFQQATNLISEDVAPWIKENMGAMLDEKLIGRMAMLYLGSRVLGYDHVASLRYSTKDYLTQYDAQAKASAKSGIKKIGGKVYHRLAGVLTTTIDGNGRESVMVKGQRYLLDDPRIAPYLEDYQDSIHDVTNIKKSFRDDGQIFIDGVNQTITDVDKQVPKSLAVNVSDEAASLYNASKKRYGGMNVAQREDLMRNLNLAQDKYYQDYAQWIANGKEKGTKPISLEAYFKNQQMNVDTGGAISTTDTEGTAMKTIAKIDRTVAEKAYEGLSGEDKQRPDLAAKEYKRIWKNYKDTWTKYSTMAATGKAPKTFSTASGDGKNAFMNWVEQCQQGKEKALEIFKIVKQ